MVDRRLRVFRNRCHWSREWFLFKQKSHLSKVLSFDRLPEEIWCSQQILARERVADGIAVAVRACEFHLSPITHRAWDRRNLLFLLYNAKIWAKIAKNGHYALIGARWGERHYRVTWSIWTLMFMKQSPCTVCKPSCVVHMSFLPLQNITSMKKGRINGSRPKFSVVV